MSAIADPFTAELMRALPEITQGTTPARLPSLPDGAFDRELSSALERVGKALLGGQEINPLDKGALFRMEKCGSPRVRIVARQILRAENNGWHSVSNEFALQQLASIERAEAKSV